MNNFLRRTLVTSAALVPVASACGDSDSETKLTIERLTTRPADKLDLVLVIDNSSSMADKQAVLADALPELVADLADPPCLDDATGAPVAGPRPGPLGVCAEGSTRAFRPVHDIHVGILSSSLGTFGASGCRDVPPPSCVGVNPSSISNNDHGRLVTRRDPCGSADLPTYKGQGFVAWDPTQSLNPPGLGSLDDLRSDVRELVLGVGQLGCGFESQNEAWYRFLVDPTPYETITLTNNQVETAGLDSVLLAQRKAFLRPDSLLAVVVVSDETDTSLKQTGSFPLFAAVEQHLPHPSAACGEDGGASDPCCHSCGEAAPSSCGADPTCEASPSYTNADENTQLRAYGLTTHKARYGVEAFYPPSRYVTALTAATVTDADGNDVPNPIFSNLDPTAYPNVAVRAPSRVFYGTIVGVPWQLVARQEGGVPDLTKGFKSTAELALENSDGDTFWDVIVGDPERYVPPTSPFMQESSEARTGVDPITGAAIADPSTPNGGGSQSGGALINDHERTIANPADDIQYACTFTLPTERMRDCSTGSVSCDCPTNGSIPTDNPLCNGTTQVAAKAYPGLKHLAIAKGMGAQGVVGSICPAQLDAPDALDYGYRPAVRALASAVAPTFSEPCLTRALEVDDDQRVACVLVEALNTGSEACTCDAATGRAPVAGKHAAIVADAKDEPQFASAQWNCFCELTQLEDAELAACQTEAGADGDGWCYVDPAHGGASGLVAACPASERQRIRFVGDAEPRAAAATFLACPR